MLRQLPNLKMIMRKAESGNFCQAEPTTAQFAPAGNTTVDGGWYVVSVPTAAFACGAAGGVSLAQADQLEFRNEAERNAIVCIGDITIQR